ncbi:MAG TPA: PQQ-binding-like beta-propeller repeat protein, partial [Actinomycetota bacterium]|nr:PQQ-binding-like beta-propeller repeat protein [Actinomycetota bacterium]
MPRPTAGSRSPQRAGAGRSLAAAVSLAALVLAGPAMARPLTTSGALATSLQGAGEGAWPQVGADAARTGTSSGGAPPPYRRAWTAEVPGGPAAGPVAAGGNVVVVAARAVVALDALTGEARWQAPRSPGPAGPAAL